MSVYMEYFVLCVRINARKIVSLLMNRNARLKFISWGYLEVVLCEIVVEVRIFDRC